MTLPELTVSNPPIIFRSVDLPLPLFPIIKTSPLLGKRRLILSSAFVITPKRVV